eukprot:TRINITY_DN2674_c0_g1_i1.p2 TRINITY_DN2674_c0_g1~~TRINITY_DN2674_c0_g1_i1.p2  ORF type:complete len:135 (+),score=22.42 TRINITY_DN2674_c0_g1_i1:82-486(+)
MIRRPPRSTQGVSSAASDVYKRQVSTQSTWGIIRIKQEMNARGNSISGPYQGPKMVEGKKFDTAAAMSLLQHPEKFCISESFPGCVQMSGSVMTDTRAPAPFGFNGAQDKPISGPFTKLFNDESTNRFDMRFGE